MTKPRTSSFLSVLIFSLGLVICGGTAAAEQLPPSVIAVVDLVKVMEEAKVTKGLRERIDKTRKKWLDHFDKKRSSLRKKQEEIREKREILGEEAYSEEVRQWEETAAAENKELKTKQEEIEAVISEAAGEVDKALAGILLTLARANGANLVLDKNSVVTSEPNLEITDQVMKELDKTLPTIDIKLPEPE